MFNDNITNYDDKLAFAIQNDYLVNASNYRLAKEAKAQKGILVSTYKYLKSFVAPAA